MGSVYTENRFDQGPCPTYGQGFVVGNSIRFYLHSLYWLVHHAGLVDVVTEVLRDGEPVIYGEIQVDELDRLMAEPGLRGLQRHPWGFSWPFKSQARGGEDDFSNFAAWRDSILSETYWFNAGLHDPVDQPTRLM